MPSVILVKISFHSSTKGLARPLARDGPPRHTRNPDSNIEVGGVIDGEEL